MNKIVKLFIPVLSSLVSSTFGQTNYYFGPEKKIVKLDPQTDVPESELPFDRNFFIRAYLSKEFQPLSAALLVEVKDKNTYNSAYRNVWNNAGTVSGVPIYTGIRTSVAPSASKPDYDSLASYDIFIKDPLLPNRTYDIQLAHNMSEVHRKACVEALFDMYKNGETITPYAQGIIDRVNTQKLDKGDIKAITPAELQLYYDQNVKTAIRAAADTSKYRTALVKSLNQPVLDPTLGKKDVFYMLRIISATSSTTVAFKLETRARNQLQPDFGLVFYGLGGNNLIGVNSNFYGLTPYVGVNYLFRQFDADIKLSQIPKGRIHFFDLLSVNIGLTLSSLAKDNQRANLFNKFNPMLGLGIRFSNAIKFNAGVIVYKKLNENPLVDKSRVQLVGYAGISIDLRIRDVIGDIGKLLTN